MTWLLVIVGLVVWGLGAFGTWELFRLVDDESPTKGTERLLAAAWPVTLPILGAVIIATAPGDRRRAQHRD